MVRFTPRNMSRTGQDKRQLSERKTATDAVLAERHAGFDRAAQDRTPKYHRPHFAVVGEGSKSANSNYAENYDRINWSK